ncbi:PulJ/GspJ family protein [Angustibacter luteus]|uniref:Type II secretion system protein n=1 Tax=Angustibacter luteus TaxID=658456 RepID=A0ABW1J9A4_9ACTN
MTVLRLRLPRRRLDEGFTLVEMLTTMLLLSVISALAFGALIGTQKTVRGNIGRLDQTQQAKVAGDTITKNLRTAVLPSQILGTCTDCQDAAFLSGDWNKVSFFANINNPANTVGPSKVTYALAANGSLTETVQPPNAHAADDYNYTYCAPISATCKAYSRTVARNVVASATAPIFTYYDYSGGQLSVPITGTTLADVNSINIVLTIKSSKEVKGGTIVTHVTMPNADSLEQSTATATATP